MFSRICLDDWFEVGKEPEGFQNKLWFANPISGQVGLFKYGLSSSSQFKNNSNGFDEKFTCELARIMNIFCADGDMAVYKNKQGFVSYNFVQESQMLKHGHELLCEYYSVEH